MLAIVLKVRDIRKDDRMITVYTEEKGKITATVRGALKIQSKLASHTQPIRLGEFRIVPGKEWNHIAAAHTVESYEKIQASLEKIRLATTCVQLVDIFTRDNDKDERIFFLLARYLDYIEAKENITHSDSVRIAVSFAWRLFDYIGYHLQIPPEKKDTTVTVENGEMRSIENGKGMRLTQKERELLKGIAKVSPNAVANIEQISKDMVKIMRIWIQKVLWDHYIGTKFFGIHIL